METTAITIKKHWFIQSRQGKIEDYYTFRADKDVVGTGTYGSVIKATAKGTNLVRAIKVIPKAKVKNAERFKSEIEILRTLDHPNIIKLFETFEDTRNVYLVMEMCTGGELFDRIIERGHFNEAEAKSIFSQIMKAINYCHAIKICHRDLKPENFLFANKDPNSPIKVIDFGLSKVFAVQDDVQAIVEKEDAPVKRREKRVNMQTKAGTPYYISPEVLQGTYDESCDIWSAGVILYILLCGYPPFYGNTDPQILEAVKKGAYNFEGPEWKPVSEDAKDLIKKMITKPEKRLKAQEVLAHPWMNEKDDAAKKAISLDWNIWKQFQGHERLKKAAMTYIAAQLSENELRELKLLFDKLDVDGNGMLTSDEVKAGLINTAGVDPKAIDAAFKAIDVDNSGFINYTEFLAATMQKQHYVSEEKIFHAFSMFDKNKDGKITAEEIKDVLGAEGSLKGTIDASVWGSIVGEVDKNGDGVIDLKEFTDMMSNLKIVDA